VIIGWALKKFVLLFLCLDVPKEVAACHVAMFAWLMDKVGQPIRDKMLDAPWLITSRVKKVVQVIF
jgi:hypothetical protein